MTSYSNLFVDQGSDFRTLVEVTDDSNIPVDLTDFEVNAQIRSSYSASRAYDFVTNINDAINGQIQLYLPASTSGSMRPGRYVYDVFAQNTVDSEKFKIVEGILEIVPRVTRFE